MADYRALSDHDLVSLLGDGDHAAYTEIYERYFGVLYLHGRKKIRDNEEVSDVVSTLNGDAFALTKSACFELT